MHNEDAGSDDIGKSEPYHRRMVAVGIARGHALAEKWHLSEEIAEVIAYHHDVDRSKNARSLVALVHLSDLLCRMRGLGYGYYERQKVDLVDDPAWQILLQEHRDLEGVDLEHFTFELDDAVTGVYEMVTTIFGSGLSRK